MDSETISNQEMLKQLFIHVEEVKTQGTHAKSIQILKGDIVKRKQTVHVSNGARLQILVGNYKVAGLNLIEK